MIFDPKEMLGILDLRSMGYYKIKQGILQQSLSKYYRFESADILYEQLNNFINTLILGIYSLTTYLKENKGRKEQRKERS